MPHQRSFLMRFATREARCSGDASGRSITFKDVSTNGLLLAQLCSHFLFLRPDTHQSRFLFLPGS
jgi:hypothetical protein